MQTAIYPFLAFRLGGGRPPFGTSCHFPRKTGKFTRRRRLKYLLYFECFEILFFIVRDAKRFYRFLYRLVVSKAREAFFFYYLYGEVVFFDKHNAIKPRDSHVYIILSAFYRQGKGDYFF